MFRFRRAEGIVWPGRDPEPAARVPGHLHRLGELGKLLLAREQVHLEPLVQLHFRNRLLGLHKRVRTVGIRPRLAGRHRRHRWQRCCFAGEIPALRHAPDLEFEIGRHDVPLAQLLGDHLKIGNLRPALPGKIGALRAATVNSVAVERAVAVVPHLVLGVDRGPQFRVDRRRRRPAEEGREDLRGQLCLARLGQVNAVERQRLLPFFRRLGK